MSLLVVEIIKANAQSRQTTRRIVLKVIDQRLLNRDRGIIQGMSGSPILQNGVL